MQHGDRWPVPLPWAAPLLSAGNLLQALHSLPLLPPVWVLLRGLGFLTTW